MRMPLISRLIFTLTAIGLCVGAHLADYATATHIFNPNWPPHAKFHTGQTLSMSIVLAALTLFFVWRKSEDRKTTMFAVIGIASTYLITQATAVLYPGTAFYDPEFVTPKSFTMGLPAQVYVEIVFTMLIALASWLAMRRSARWSA